MLLVFVYTLSLLILVCYRFRELLEKNIRHDSYKKCIHAGILIPDFYRNLIVFMNNGSFNPALLDRSIFEYK